MATLLPTFSITLSQRQWPCVLDPFLALSPHGLSLARQLGRVMELWVVRELWHILDNTCFYRQYPETEVLPEANLFYSSRLSSLISDENLVSVLDKKALEEWEYARTDINLTGLNLFWIGDQLGQSLLPEGVQSNIIKRYERLACDLENRPQQDATTCEPFKPAARDALALAVTLDSAFILTYLPNQNHSQKSQSVLFDALDSWHIPYTQVDDTDAIVSIERDYIRHLLVHAGLSSILWSSGLRLAILHLSLPAAPSILIAEDDPDEIDIGLLNACNQGWRTPNRQTQNSSASNLWAEARGFWYAIT